MTPSNNDEILTQLAMQFEEVWRNGGRPDVEDFLQRVQPDQRLELAQLLRALDAEYEHKDGLPPGTDRQSLEQTGQSSADHTQDAFANALTADESADGVASPDYTLAYDKEADAHPHAGSRMIGPYRLLRRLGEGGMGEVWMAEQEKPVRRQVALKLIKSGMDNKQILVRFEAERQALAMMDHPNIAKVLDVGTTTNGQPFFVMELLKGQTLTRYCDESKMGIEDRLKLFLDICGGVQHAHQKGIIHRDLKPGNIMVDTEDGKPVPKIIDFGLAKAMETTQRLTDQSLFTGIGQILGTLKYMSPEQASLDNLDIDTRTDIYALGVILYELLTGATPLDDSTIKSMAALQILNVIRGQEAVKPSSKLSLGTDAELSVVTGNRRTDVSRLKRLLARDLDWIVIKALEKDRTRRYESASGFAADIRRYLSNEPVIARPPSVGYRLRKFVRKHRAGVVAAAIVAVALVGGMTGTTLSLFRALRAEAVAELRFTEANDARLSEEKQRKLADARRIEAERAQRQAEQARLEQERQRKFAEAINEFVIEDFLALTSVEGQERFGGEGLDRETTLYELLERAAEKLRQRTDLDPLIEAELSLIIGINYRGQGDAAKGISFVERSVELRREHLGADDPETLDSMNSLAMTLEKAGQLSIALPLYERTLELQKARLGTEHPSTLSTMDNLAVAYLDDGALDKALSVLEQTLELKKAVLGPEHPDTLRNMNNLAQAYSKAGALDKALPLFEQTLELAKLTLGPTHVGTLVCMNNLAQVYKKAGAMDKAIPTYEQTLELMKTILGPEHPNTLTSMNNLAGAYRKVGELNKALSLYEQTLELSRAKLGVDHPNTLMSMGNLALAYYEAGELNKALPLNEQTLELKKGKFGPQHPETLTTMNNLALTYLDAGDLKKALPLFAQTLELNNANLGPEHPSTLTGMHNLALGYSKNGELDKALSLFEETSELQKDKLGADHPSTLICMNELAQAYHDTGAVDKALPMLEQTVALQKAKVGPEHPETLRSMNNLANAYLDAGALDEALSLHQQTLELRKVKLGADHPDTLTSMDNLATYFLRVGQLERSALMFEELIPICVKKRGRAHPDSQKVIAHLGVNYKDTGRVNEAIPLLEEAYETSKRWPTLAWVREPLADAYLLAKDVIKVTAFGEESVALARQQYAAGSLELAEVLVNLAGTYLLAEAMAAAEPLLREGLDIRVMLAPDAWDTFNAQVMLGTSLLGQQKYVEAEPLLLKGYEGVKERGASIPPEAADRLPEALARLIEVYTALEKPELVAKYRQLQKQDSTSDK